MTAVDETAVSVQELNEFIGNHIRAYRARRGLTQAALAAEVGVYPATLSSWETGSVAPSVASLVAIATALGVDPGVLLPKGGQ